MTKVFALIDCNNFFVSCERIFRPDLEGQPVVVLSSNDGCAVARSNEAKQLGIPMGAPAFKYKQLFKDNSVRQFSANFELYGDISKRIISLLTTVTPRIEVYSVDESFLDLTELGITDYIAWGKAVRSSILRHIGVPVSIGIAPTKTLAKLTSEIAKRQANGQGVMSFIDLSEDQKTSYLAAMPVRDVWGVGRQLGPKLRAEGVGTALSLSQMPLKHAQQLMGIHGRQMVSELNGISCYPLEGIGSVAKSIMRSRTFGEDTDEPHILESAIATLGAQAAFRLRRAKLLTRRVGLFTMTNYHKPGFRRWSFEVRLPQPTSDSGTILTLLMNEFDKIYEPRQQYHRLGIYMHDFVSEESLQIDLLGDIDPETHDRSAARMQAIDHINRRLGKGKIYYAAEDLSKSWQPKHQIRSPRYVSKWDELPRARITESS